MKKIYALSLTAIAVFFAASPLSAQTTAINTGYFTDGYVMKHKLNPAIPATMSYAAIPFPLNISVGTQGNISASSILFPLASGKIGTGFHPEISAAQLLGGLKDINKINEMLNYSMISVGFWNSKGTIFNTIDLDIRQNLYTSIPKGFFEFAKNSHPGTTYNMGGTRLNMYAYSMLSFGQSFKVGQKVRIGYKAKFIIAPTMAELQYDKFDATLTNSRWDVTAQGEVKMSNLVKFKNVPVDPSDPSKGKKMEIIKPNGEELLSGAFGGMGFAADLGVTYDITDWLQVSAALQDIGFASYRETQSGTCNQSVTYQPDPTRTPADQLKNALEDLKDMVYFEDKGFSRYTTMLPTILRAGVQARLPMYQKLSLGVLYTHQLNKALGWFEIRPSLNYDVLRWLGLSFSYANGTFGSQFGALVNVHTRGFTFYLGADNIPFKYTSKGIPLKTGTATATIGIAFQFGKYFGRYPKKTE